MKKAKTLETKLRSALRLIWSRSKERKAVINQAIHDAMYIGDKKSWFNCPDCNKSWPHQMAEVDHEPPIGPLESWKDTSTFIEKMFFGPQRVICKLCHRKKTTDDRKKMKKARKE